MHPNKELLIVSTFDSKVSIYSFKLESPLAVLSTKNKTPISAFDPEGRTFAVATDDYTITMYDCKTYSPFDTFNLSSHVGKKSYICYMAFSPDGRLILIKTNSGKVFTISSSRGELFQEYRVLDKSPSKFPSHNALKEGEGDEKIHMARHMHARRPSSATPPPLLEILTCK